MIADLCLQAFDEAVHMPELCPHAAFNIACWRVKQQIHSDAEVQPNFTTCAGDLAPSTPLNSESCIFTYAANEKVSEFLEDYLNQTAEANTIAHELVCSNI